MTPHSLEELLDRFIDYKHSLGYVYDTQERYLGHYRDYMRESFPDVPVPDKESTDGFLSLYQGMEGGLYNAMAPLREFSRYLCRIGYKDAYVIPPKQMPRLHPDPPYFLSEKETSAFFAACDRYFADHSGPAGRGIVMPAEFRLLYCCGLRPKEARTTTLPVILGDMKARSAACSPGGSIFSQSQKTGRIPSSSFITTSARSGSWRSPAGTEILRGYTASATILPGLQSTAGQGKGRM